MYQGKKEPSDEDAFIRCFLEWSDRFLRAETAKRRARNKAESSKAADISKIASDQDVGTPHETREGARVKRMESSRLQSEPKIGQNSVYGGDANA